MLAIMGGSGLTQLANLEVTQRKVARTPYGEPSGPLTFGRIAKRDVIFLARHGYGHTIAPHEVNRSEERRVGKECRSLCDWSSDVCSSDLWRAFRAAHVRPYREARRHFSGAPRLWPHHRASRGQQIGRASCRERV